MQEHVRHRQDPHTAAVEVLQHSSKRRHAMAADVLWPLFSVLNQASALHVLPAQHARADSWVKAAQPDCKQVCLRYTAHEYMPDMQCSYAHCTASTNHQITSINAQTPFSEHWKTAGWVRHLGRAFALYQSKLAATKHMQSSCICTAHIWHTQVRFTMH